MSDRRHPDDDTNPTSFANATPATDQLAGRRSEILYAIGQLQTDVKYLARDINTQSEKMDRLADRTERELKERFSEVSENIKEQSKKIDSQKEAITALGTQIATARSVFYTSKWFVGGVVAIAVFLIDHLGAFLHR